MVILQNTHKLYTQAEVEKMLSEQYAIAFEAGRQAERIVTIQDDDDLRFIKRVLSGESPIDQDKEECLRLIHGIRTRIRSTK